MLLGLLFCNKISCLEIMIQNDRNENVPKLEREITEAGPSIKISNSVGFVRVDHTEAHDFDIQPTKNKSK